MSDLHILQSASSRNHTLRLFVSNGEDGREYDDGSFQLFVHHYDGHVMWNGTIEYQVTIPDLAVRDYGFDAPVIVGEPNLVLVTVENRGDGWSRETMVVLVRESNGEEINRTKVPKLAPGGKVSVPMDFILEASRDFFGITVDPDDDVNEAGDGDNSRRFGVTGMVTGPGTPSPAFSFLLGFLIMLALTVGAFGAYHLWKSRT